MGGGGMNECCTRNHIYLNISWYLHFIFSLQGCLTVSQAILYKKILCLISLQRNVKLKLVFYVPNLLQCEQWLEIKLDMRVTVTASLTLWECLLWHLYTRSHISSILSFFYIANLFHSNTGMDNCHLCSSKNHI